MTADIGNNSSAQLRSIIERVENVEASIAELRVDRSEIYQEASGNGYDVPALKAIVKARRETTEQKAKREAREFNEGIYRGALGI